MIATFVPHDPKGTIFEPATGHALTVNIPNGFYGQRVVLIVNDEDHAKIERNLTHEIVVTDLMTGITHRLIGDDCGLGCRCAVRFA